MRILKSTLKIFGFIILGLILVVVIALAYLTISAKIKTKHNMALLGPETRTLTIGGFTFRDLNKNGKLDIYEDKRHQIEARVSDLLRQMTLEEKAGTMFHTPINTGDDGELSESPDVSAPLTFLSPSNTELLINKKITTFNVFSTPDARHMAMWQNAVQKVAERMRLGIPVSLSSDPRSHFSNNALVASFAKDFSVWPEPTGFAAIGDTVLMRKFGEMVSQEYRAVGIRIALHPQVDLATEPRWSRISGTFGEDATLTAKMAYAYIKGFQGDSLSSTSVACITKHFSGGGPQKEGLDPHFSFQKGQVYPGRNFKYHLIPFESAFRAGTAQIMPYYGVPMDQTSENVGFAFNKDIITNLLRKRYHFDGVVCTDWGVISQTKVLFWTIEPRARGVEKLTDEQRMLKVIDAGCDQFGGENIPEMLVKLVKEKKITETRIDQSVRRILRDKFKLGLFDNPYVDIDKASTIVGRKDFIVAGFDAQRKSLALLKNGTVKNKSALPLQGGIKIYVEGVNKDIAAKYAIVVDKPEDADFAILRTETPYQERKGILEGLFHHGDLDFKGKAKEEILKLLAKVPTIVDIHLDRPAVIPEISAKCAGLIGSFGSSDAALLDVIFGRAKPEGHLPFELPSSMKAVRNQKEDVPYDSKDPLYRFGFGLRY